MPNEKLIGEVLGRMAADIPGFIGAALVDLESGLTLGMRNDRPEFDLVAASAYNSEMVRQKLRILSSLRLRTPLEDMILTFGDQIHMIKIVSPSTFIYLAADRASTNLAIVMTVVNRNIAQLS